MAQKVLKLHADKKVKN